MAHRSRNHHAQLLGRRKSWLKRPLRGPRPDFWGFWSKTAKSSRYEAYAPPPARANRYFRHNSGSTAQNLDFFGSSVAESQCATFRSPENLAETASTGPRSIFFLDFWPVLSSPKKTQVPGPPKSPKTQKNRNSAKMRPFHRNFCSWTPPPMCSG